MRIKDRGDLDRIVIIEVRSEGTNSINEIIDSWATLKTVWAHYDSGINSGINSETIGSEREINTDIVTFTISYESVKDIYVSMAKNHRIDYGGRKFDILGHEEEGRRQYITFKCRHDQ